MVGVHWKQQLWIEFNKGREVRQLKERRNHRRLLSYLQKHASFKTVSSLKKLNNLIRYRRTVKTLIL